MSGEDVGPKGRVLGVERVSQDVELAVGVMDDGGGLVKGSVPNGA